MGRQLRAVECEDETSKSSLEVPDYRHALATVISTSLYMYMCFVDLKKAYDSVLWDALFFSYGLKK